MQYRIGWVEAAQANGGAECLAFRVQTRSVFARPSKLNPRLRFNASATLKKLETPVGTTTLEGVK